MRLYEIAHAVSGEVVGDGNTVITGLSPINEIAPGSIVYADGLENLQRVEQSEAAAVLVGSHLTSSVKPVIQVKRPAEGFIQLLAFYQPKRKALSGIHETAVIASNVQIGQDVSVGPFVCIDPGSVLGDGCVIGAHVVIGQNVRIGPKTTLFPHVTIYDDCEIGSNVRIHASSVIGSDGFGYTFLDGEHKKLPHIGCVVIEDDVEIGANTVVDRATIGTTRIGKGTKIDNFVQIAHSVKLGEHNILCGFTGIAGSTVTGNHVICAADVGVGDHVKIDDGVILAARAGVPSKKHLRKGNVYLGNPARPRNKALEQELSMVRLPYIQKKQRAIAETIDKIEERLAALEGTST